MNLNINDYELARPGQSPEELLKLRETLHPDELFTATSSGEFVINHITFASKRDDNVPRLRLRPTTTPMTTFEIRTGHPETSKELWKPVGDTFTDLEAAKLALAQYKATSTGLNFAMRKQTELLPDLDPREWAQRRIETGEWEFPDWANEPWYNPELGDHLAHLSVGQPGNIAYYQTRRDALNDWCAIKPVASYLKTFYGDVLSASDISKIVYKADPPGDLVLSGSDPDAIVKVYRESGIGSCMMNRSAVRIYGAGDLQMATLVRNGKITARALCWPERKFVGAIYGDVVRMKIALELEGYTRDYNGQSTSGTEGNGGFEGARMLKIPCKSGWVMPWIDLGYRVWDDGKFFRLSLKRGACVNNTSNSYSGSIPYFESEPERKAA